MAYKRYKAHKGKSINNFGSHKGNDSNRNKTNRNAKNRSSREELLKKILEKQKKKRSVINENYDGESNSETGNAGDSSNSVLNEDDLLDKDKVQKILGYEIMEDRSVERIKQKKKVSRNNAEEKKKSAMESKPKQSSRDLLIQKIKELEQQISTTKYNKRTQHAIGLMKAQLANLKQKLASSAKTGTPSKDGYAVKKSGDGTVVLLGFPSSGKSTLLNKLTNANSPVGEYAFTTLTVIPGMMKYRHAKIQVLDVPGIIEGAASGLGRGKEVLQVIRSADLILMLIDAFKPQQLKLIKKEVYDANIRINAKKPNVTLKKTAKDGIRIGRTVPTPELDDETIKGILKQFRIMNAEVVIREDINADQFIDVIEGNKVYIPSISVVNKIDLIKKEQQEQLNKLLMPDLMISADKEQGIDEVKELIFDRLNFIRIYLKEIDKKPDLDEPLIMRKGNTLRDLCQKLHKDFVEKFRFARIWGKSVKFPGQRILKLDHELKDEDIVEIHIK